MLHQIHLKGKRFCGRGVRMRELDPVEHEECLGDAAKVLGPEATGIQIQTLAWTIGVKRALVAFTEPCEDASKPDVKWHKFDPGTIDEKYSELFGAKDGNALSQLYRDLHEVTKEEMDAIVGKALPVSEA